ncbi:MAG: urease subunit beta [Litorilinea sp.]
MIPGEILIDDDAAPIVANIGRPTATITVRHVGDRPIQVGSHYHFFEVNSSLAFDRRVAYGMRLNIPAGTAVRFEPGDEKEVTLTHFAGRRVVYGARGLVQGRLDDAEVQTAALNTLSQ